MAFLSFVGTFDGKPINRNWAPESSNKGSGQVWGRQPHVVNDFSVLAALQTGCEMYGEESVLDVFS